MTSDDVSIGQLVAVIGHRCNEEDCQANFTGHPFKVLAISLPFAVMEDLATGERNSIDLRQWQLGRVDARYVSALLGETKSKSKRREQEQRDDGHQRCVRCGERMIQRMFKTDGKWHWACEQCKAVGEVVEK